MSKRIWQHPELPADESGVVSWRSVGELERSAAFQEHLEREFPEGSGHLSEEEREGTRRNFLKLMGASSALSGLALVSCRRPTSYIVPYKQAPEWVIPGKPLYYASTRPRAEGAVPLVVTTFEGRPTKLAPNTEHPDGGGTDALTQASVLNLYDPNRSRDFLHKGKKSSRKKFSAALAELATSGGKFAFLFGEDDCPTRHRLKGELASAFPQSKFYSYEALCGPGKRAAHTDAFEDGADVTVDFAKADRVLSLDCDFLALDPQGSSIEFSRRRQGGDSDYTSGVKAAEMNRLYSVETAYSLTGGMADHRLRVAPSRVFRVAAEIARQLLKLLPDEPKKALNKITAKIPLLVEEKGELFDGDEKLFDQWTAACAKDLFENAGRAVVLAGSRHEKALHQLAIAMNKALKAYEDGPLSVVMTGRAGYGTIDELVEEIDSKTTVVLLGPSNPVYDTPADLKFSGALGRAKSSIHLGLRTDASALAATWHVPAAHYLESWSDARTATGVYSLVQPMILPLYGGVSELELLAQLIAWKEIDGAKVKSGEAKAPVLVSGEGEGGTASPAYDEVRKTFVGVGGEGDTAWKEALRTGYVAQSTYEPAAIKDEIGEMIFETPPAPGEESLEVSFMADASVWDGRYIDNGWLQEAPDPISKLSWDNAAFVSPKTAERLGIYDEVVELMPKNKTLLGKIANAPKPLNGEGKNAKAPEVIIKANGLELRIPVLVSFGHADNCITIPLGYGQGASDRRDNVTTAREDDPYATVGLVGINTGFNGNALRLKRDGGFRVHDAKVEVTRDKYPIALVQEHHAMHGRALAREVSTHEVAGKSFEEQVKKVAKQGPVDSHAPENISLYKRQGSTTWEGDKDKQEDLISDKIHQWGMSIDLNTCMGCNACMVACQAENNIPIVGKEQVAMGREMHWIRMDRYYAAPTYERDDHGHIEKDGGEKKHTPDWVQNNPELVPQPVACMQCENAPCETVCPVNATVHTEEGLNAMSYNRCIGTRYCANNCPYKARRFNYFDYNKRNPLIAKNLYQGPFGESKAGDAPHLQRNPNVSVRMRGVMEKCTYCVQRLESAKIKQKQILRKKTLQAPGKSTSVAIDAGDLRIAPDVVQTACQEACPTEAISFGNLLDKKKAKVWRAKYKGEKEDHGVTVLELNPRNYDVLQYIGTSPRTSYLARVKNPNKNMPDAKYRGLATIHTA